MDPDLKKFYRERGDELECPVCVAQWGEPHSSYCVLGPALDAVAALLAAGVAIDERRRSDVVIRMGELKSVHDALNLFREWERAW